MTFDEMAAEMQQRRKMNGLKNDIIGALALTGMMVMVVALIGIFGGMH